MTTEKNRICPADARWRKKLTWIQNQLRTLATDPRDSTSIHRLQTRIGHQRPCESTTSTPGSIGSHLVLHRSTTKCPMLSPAVEVPCRSCQCHREVGRVCRCRCYGKWGGLATDAAKRDCFTGLSARSRSAAPGVGRGLDTGRATAVFGVRAAIGAPSVLVWPRHRGVRRRLQLPWRLKVEGWRRP